MKRHVLVGLMALSMACSGPTAPDHEPMVGVQVSCDGCFTGYPGGNGSIGRVTAVAAGTFTLTVVAECGSYGRVTGSFLDIEIVAQSS